MKFDVENLEHGDMGIQYEENYRTSQACLTQPVTMQRYAEFPGHSPTIALKSEGAGAPSHTSLVMLPPTLHR